MPTLLAVDDSVELLNVRVALFSSIGFEVIAYSNPLNALRGLATRKIDVIVTDYDMPEMDGLAFSRDARTLGFRGPIILSTGSDNIPAWATDSVNSLVPKSAGCQLLLRTVVSALADDDQAELSLKFDRLSRERARALAA